MVCTVPPTALGALRLPGLSAHKQRAICGTGASLVLKVALAFERPWWEAHPSGGRTWSDGLLQQTWAPVQAEGPVLMAYVCGWRAAQLRAAPVRMAHAELVQRFPEAQAGCLGGWAHDWQATPFVGIAHEHLRTGLGPRHLGRGGATGGLHAFRWHVDGGLARVSGRRPGKRRACRGRNRAKPRSCAMQALGRQILVEFYDCDEDVFADEAAIRQHVIDAVAAAGATIVTDTFHHFS